MYVTKFPGGGMEFGEGTIDCIKRECMEEFGEEVEVTGVAEHIELLRQIRTHAPRARALANPSPEQARRWPPVNGQLRSRTAARH